MRRAERAPPWPTPPACCPTSERLPERVVGSVDSRFPALLALGGDVLSPLVGVDRLVILVGLALEVVGELVLVGVRIVHALDVVGGALHGVRERLALVGLLADLRALRGLVAEAVLDVVARLAVALAGLTQGLRVAAHGLRDVAQGEVVAARRQRVLSGLLASVDRLEVGAGGLHRRPDAAVVAEVLALAVAPDAVREPLVTRSGQDLCAAVRAPARAPVLPALRALHIGDTCHLHAPRSRGLLCRV